MASVINAGTTTATALSITTDTTGALNIQTSGTTAIAISAAQAVTLTNPLPAGSGGTGLSSLGTGVATFLGTPSSANLLAAVTDETGTGALVFASSPTLAGTPLAPTAAPGTNTTQIATTAYATAAITAQGLGTMSTQNANAVAITGGTVAGITDLAVADGGTGSSTLAANAVLLGNGTSALQTVAPSTAGNVLSSNGTTWTSTTIQSSGAKLGLGITGEVWNNMTGSRALGTTYTNSRGYPIMISVNGTGSGSSGIFVNVNGSQIYRNQAQWNGSGAIPGAVIIIPTGATYSVTMDTSGLNAWWELY
jgi:hypothetical protein